MTKIEAASALNEDEADAIWEALERFLDNDDQIEALADDEAFNPRLRDAAAAVMKRISDAVRS